MYNCNTVCVFLFWTFLLFQQINAADDEKTTSASNLFNCNVCSYTDTTGSEVSCLNNTNYLRTVIGHSLKCGNYCVTSEVWDKRSRKVKSIFRSCSTFWGNDCSDGWDIVTCKTSCKGDNCNNFTMDESRIDTLCDRYQCGNTGFTLFTTDIHIVTYIIVLSFVVIGYCT